MAKQGTTFLRNPFASCLSADTAAYLPTFVLKKTKKTSYVCECILCSTGQKPPLLFSQRTNPPPCSCGSVHTDDSYTHIIIHMHLHLPIDYNTLKYVDVHMCKHIDADP